MAYNAPTFSTISQEEFIGSYAKAYIDSYSLSGAVPMFKEQVYPQLFRQFGKGFDALEFLRMAGREMYIKGRRLTAFEEPEGASYVTLATALESDDSTGYGAGGTIYFKIDSGDYDSNRNGPLRVGFGVEIPGMYVGKSRSATYIVKAIHTSSTHGGLSAGTGADSVYEAAPLSSSSDITLDVPINEKLMISYSAYGAGSGQPSPMNKGMLQRDFYTHISKETGEIEGGVNSHERYEVIEVNGQRRIWDKMMEEASFRLDKQINHAIWNSEKNTNSITATNTPTGSATTLLTTEGILPIVDSLGQEIVLSSTWDSFNDFDALKNAFLSQGVVAQEAMFWVGSTLFSQIENTLLNEMEYKSDGFYDKELQQFGVNYKKVKKNNVTYYIMENTTLSNPMSFGISNYKMANQGICIPLTSVATTWQGDDIQYNGTVSRASDGKIFLPNMALAYLGGYGEDRRKIIKPVHGVNGFDAPATNQYDKSEVYLLSEYMLFLMQANQIVWVH